MRGACPAFHEICNNFHKKGQFANVCMSTNKSLNCLDNQNTQPTTAEESLDKGNIFIGAIFDISNEVTLNTNRINICCKIDSGAQVNVIAENQIETLPPKPRITKE